MSGRSVYVSRQNLAFCRAEAQAIIEQEMGMWSASTTRQAQIAAEAQSIVRWVFGAPGYLINLVADLDASGDHRLARRFVNEIGAALLHRHQRAS